MMTLELKNEKHTLTADIDRGTVEGIRFHDDADGMNWIISRDMLLRYGYSDAEGCLLGKSVIEIAEVHDTGGMKPSDILWDDSSIRFEYQLPELLLQHTFILEEDSLRWDVLVQNLTGHDVVINKMYHWLPVAYVMHETTDENYNHSCAFVPSVTGGRSFVICKKRSGEGPDLLIVNQGEGMKSTGSLCKYKNLFFEKQSPSLSGLVLYNTVNTYRNADVEENPSADWPYRDMYTPICLESGQTFSDSYSFFSFSPDEERKVLKKAGIPYIVCPPVAYVGRPVMISVEYDCLATEYVVSCADEHGEREEYRDAIVQMANSKSFRLRPFCQPGERKLTIHFEDGNSMFVVFAVYETTAGIVEAFCRGIHAKRFIDDPASPEYCAYKSTSRQGESCAKGALLLLKNLLTHPDPDEVRQVERNTVHYLRKRWLDENFIAIKQYPGGFARMFDFDFLVLQFYLISLFDKSILRLNSPETYLMWAYRTLAYSLEPTSDKTTREVSESGMASMFSWVHEEMLLQLKEKGFHREADHLEQLWTKQTDELRRKVVNRTFVQTEHYFDNAGISITAESLMNAGDLEAGLQAARLLLPNVAMSNDYRNFAPDRWWEAFACMYHNLWAAFPAKAMLTAYEKSGDNRYLFSAYRSMMPMFHNYDWNAVSTLNKLSEGEGASAYCLTSPNLNLEYASRNRFGQSVFKDSFFEGIDVGGDDWDLGADLIAYLSSFGQKTYVTMDGDEPVCVNGELQGTLQNMRVESFAVYPGIYYFESFGLTLSRASSLFTIPAVTVCDGECIQIEVRRLVEGCPIQVDCTRSGQTERIHPEIVYLN